MRAPDLASTQSDGSWGILSSCHSHPNKSAIPRLKEHSPKAGAQALILAPTRELVIQLHKAVKELARYTNLRLAVLVGGDSMEAQFAELAANPDIILATPGQFPCSLDLFAAITVGRCKQTPMRAFGKAIPWPTDP